jgi:hypothetical protein
MSSSCRTENTLLQSYKDQPTDGVKDLTAVCSKIGNSNGIHRTYLLLTVATLPRNVCIRVSVDTASKPRQTESSLHNYENLGTRKWCIQLPFLIVFKLFETNVPCVRKVAVNLGYGT